MIKYHIRVMTLAAVAFAAGCAGVKARETALMPAMSVAWSTMIAPNIEAALVDSTLSAETVRTIRGGVKDVQQLLDTGVAGNGPAIAFVWTILEPIARDGINLRITRGEIGPNGAIVLRETLRQFSLRLSQLVGN